MLPDRFMSKLRETESGCWEWLAGKDSHGYGQFGVGRRVMLAYKTCCCGYSWPADAELEAAVRAYTAFYTVPYLDAPEIPTLAAALAACRPTDSPWRRVARAGGR